MAVTVAILAKGYLETRIYNNIESKHGDRVVDYVHTNSKAIIDDQLCL